MSDRKENSTNSINEAYWKGNCGITHTISMIGSRWKINILTFLLKRGPRLRYSALRERLVGVSDRVLISKLKELEDDGLINRISYQEVPPRVEYELSTLGHSLKNILTLMDEWGEQFMD